VWLRSVAAAVDAAPKPAPVAANEDPALALEKVEIEGESDLIDETEELDDGEEDLPDVAVDVDDEEEES